MVEDWVKKNKPIREEILFVFICFVFYIVHCVAQAGFELEILLPQQE